MPKLPQKFSHEMSAKTRAPVVNNLGADLMPHATRKVPVSRGYALQRFIHAGVSVGWAPKAGGT